MIEEEEVPVQFEKPGNQVLDIKGEIGTLAPKGVGEVEMQVLDM